MKASTVFALLGSVVLLWLSTGCSLNSQGFTMNSIQADAPIDGQRQSSSLNQLYSWSEQLYNAANDSNRQQAFLLLQRMESLAADGDIRKMGTQAGWQAFERSIQRAIQAMPQKGTSQVWYTETARLKLASDALLRPAAPLWLQYEGVLKDDTQRIRATWAAQAEGRLKAVQATISVYEEHVDRLEVAALMQRDRTDIDGIKAQLLYLERLVRAADAGEVRQDKVPAALASLESASARLFRGAESEDEAALTDATPPGLSIGEQRRGGSQIAELFIAAFVMAVLGFAGWRKYRNGQTQGTSFSDRFK
ncbi:sporulation protein YpjB [Paenibacillus sp. R14(2021)]|uniref:sporulation protein YpjB n=1 Tax=Paenibacillus sp. R14(2021) TaxID=2859228 RepID=UPI001C6125C9|nr:sporulation protein YpjB [Paenibacillus sp. R14(2021)]